MYVCGDMSKSWYDEIKDYNFDTGKSTGVTGHFTQIIWKDTKEVGFGVAFKGNKVMSVANIILEVISINQLHTKSKFLSLFQEKKKQAKNYLI